MLSSPGEPHRTLIDGRYSLEAPLGRGSMGTVWKAFDSRLQRHVALKLLHHEGDGPQQHVRELQALARLRHPNLVTVLDCGTTAEGTPYLAMELVQGATLKDELERTGKLPVGRVCRIGSQVVRALIGAHAEGVVHRDLKPSNIMLSELYGERDVVKLVDFGVAHLVDATRSTRAGARFVGTTRYASPEQCRGGAITASSDLYSLGVVLFELLSGRSLFQAEEELGLLWHHVNTAPPRLSQLDASVPEWLDELLSALLAKDPKQRPRDAHEVLACFEGTRAPELSSRSARAPLEVALASVPGSSPGVAGRVRPSRGKRGLVTAAVLAPALTLALILMASKAPPSGAAQVEKALLRRTPPPDDVTRPSVRATELEGQLPRSGVEHTPPGGVQPRNEGAHGPSGTPSRAAVPEKAATGMLQGARGTAPGARDEGAARAGQAPHAEQASARRSPDGSAKSRPEEPEPEGAHLIKSKRLTREREQQKWADPPTGNEVEAK